MLARSYFRFQSDKASQRSFEASEQQVSVDYLLVISLESNMNCLKPINYVLKLKITYLIRWDISTLSLQLLIVHVSLRRVIKSFATDKRSAQTLCRASLGHRRNLIIALDQFMIQIALLINFFMIQSFLLIFLSILNYFLRSLMIQLKFLKITTIKGCKTTEINYNSGQFARSLANSDKNFRLCSLKQYLGQELTISLFNKIVVLNVVSFSLMLFQ